MTQIAERIRYPWLRDRRMAVEHVVGEMRGVEQKLIDNLFHELTAQGKSLIRRRDRNVTVGSTTTVYRPNPQGLGLFTIPLTIAKSAVVELDGSSEIMAVAYGKQEDQDGLLLVGGVHQRTILDQFDFRRNPFLIGHLLGEFPGNFFNYGDEFTFWVGYFDDERGRRLDAVSGNDKSSTVQVTSIPAPSPYCSAVPTDLRTPAQQMSALLLKHLEKT